MTLDIEQRLGELYQEHKSPAFIDWKFVCHPGIFKAANWHPGDLITKYKIPIYPDSEIREIIISDNTYQSDIWLAGKPRQRRKFRHYKRNRQ